MSEKTTSYRWTIVSLLFFATTINYLDRQVLSLLYPMLQDKFKWTNSQYANIASAFQFTYAVGLLFAGRVIDQLGTKRGYAWAIVVWSIGAMVHAWAIPIGDFLVGVLGLIGLTAVPVSVLGFMFARALLGLGEAGNFPAAIKVTAAYFPKHERSFATGIFNSGANVGAVLAPLSVPWIATTWGWEMAFVLIGGVGFIWLIFWLKYFDLPLLQKRVSAKELAYIQQHEENETIEKDNNQKVKWTKLFRYKQTWSFSIGKFLTDGVWWFFLFWLPAYLKEKYGMTATEMALPLVVLYSMVMVGSIAGGWFPAYFVKKGMNVYEGRLKAMFVIALFPLVVLAAQPLGYISFWIPVILIGIGSSAHAAWSANIFTTVSDMFPNKAIGSVVGIGGMAGGIGGVLTTKIGGALFDYYKAKGNIETGYLIMFSFCAIAYILAWIIMKSLVPKFNKIEDL
jgi:ACS family hexuronate transporter-like MFS transporter